MKYFRDTNVVRELGKTAPQENMTACLDTVDEADLSIRALTVREMLDSVGPSAAKEMLFSQTRTLPRAPDRSA
jgi:hypothetical protein